MKFDWRKVAEVTANVVGLFVPGAVAVEQGVEGVIDAKTGKDKAEQVVKSALGSLEAAATLAGKNYATPRVEAAIRKLNDDSVELLNALAEAHGE